MIEYGMIEYGIIFGVVCFAVVTGLLIFNFLFKDDISLSDQFKNLSNEILVQQADTIAKKATESVTSTNKEIIDPLKKQLDNTLEKLNLNISDDFYSGKVRENYYKGDQIVMVTSDRVSAFDHILGTIPFKGQILSDIAKFWFDKTLGSFICLVKGTVPLSGLGGPIMIAKVSGQASEIGFGALLNLMAILSINLGIINIMPLPALDGGHVLISAVEGLRRKELSTKFKLNFQKVGAILLMVLIIFVVYNDLANL